MLMRVGLPHRGKNTLYFQGPERIIACEPLVMKHTPQPVCILAGVTNDHLAPSAVGISYMLGTRVQRKIKLNKT